MNTTKKHQRPSGKHQPRSHQRKPREANDFSLAHAKKSIRDIQRILQRPELPANVRVDNERKLKAQLLHLEACTVHELERKHMLRYKRVRFFERRKAERHLKRVQKQHDADPSNVDIQRRLQDAQLDMHYVVYYPKTTKYIALYAGSKDHADDDEDEHTAKPPSSPQQQEMRSAMAQCISELEERHVKLTDEAVRTHLLRHVLWFARSHWTQVMRFNATVYEKLKLDVNTLIKQKVQEVESSTTDVVAGDATEQNDEAPSDDNDDADDNDDFFMED